MQAGLLRWPSFKSHIIYLSIRSSCDFWIVIRGYLNTFDTPFRYREGTNFNLHSPVMNVRDFRVAHQSVHTFKANCRISSLQNDYIQSWRVSYFDYTLSSLSFETYKFTVSSAAVGGMKVVIPPSIQIRFRNNVTGLGAKYLQESSTKV